MSQLPGDNPTTNLPGSPIESEPSGAHTGVMSFVTSVPFPALVSAVCAAVVLTGCGVSIELGDDVVERTETEVVIADEVERLRVETGNGRITVTGDTTGDVTVTARLRESDDGDATYSVRADDGTLVVEGRCDSGWFDQCSVGFDVTVPTGLAVDLETDNGRVAVRGLDGPIEVETDNGEIAGDGLGSSDVQVQTDNGRIELVFTTSPDAVTATTDNGAVVIRIPDDGGAHDVSTSTDNGSVDVDVRTDPTSDRAIVVETDNGSIDVEYTR